ncbi:deoxyadenosine/deoxycytidine kinase [Natronocella acetinitrilica]|jgi:deoxyguanosine kinase|uniref:Deoxyadenosine/deoxycytidine kinase n=1 Tax=Natronocella acetinitrilica TaxID=414046 RepID=A0AAE3KCI7_9GAMM|nr:deoxynucleoside kinase [Natronocella acetinitrilica]MCP1675003.1 deoxyadenosine/deoxycytidine kinase [Natronocella acetinitrilica]
MTGNLQEPPRVPRHLVVEGPIGVGKTTLARRLAQSLGSQLLLEGADENPFLERFYQSPRDAAFPTQMYFLIQRAEQLRGLRQGDLFEERHVADFLFEKDRMFAELTLRPPELALYDKIYQELAVELAPPDMVIYLQAPVDVLMERIRRRGIAHEQAITADYLQRLSDAYVNFFYHYDAAPLLIVNATAIDLADNDADYAQLLERVWDLQSGRRYFNPAPIDL